MSAIEIVYRFDPRQRKRRRLPATPLAARRRLEDGNRAFADLARGRSGRPSRHVLQLDPRDLGWSDGGSAGHAQRPFAGVLGCADARAPIEMIFQQGSNALFVVRVAGNVVGSECLGSFGYALQHFQDSLRLLTVLGHSRCGAVSAAVDAYLKPSSYLPLASEPPLKSIVDAILVSVRSAALGLERAHGPEVTKRPGYREALVTASVVVNAAWGAFALRHIVPPQQRASVDVVYGVYDLDSRYVRLLRSLAPPFPAAETGLFRAPAGLDEFRRLGAEICGGDLVNDLLC
jgi:carbonic anhydrase